MLVTGNWNKLGLLDMLLLYFFSLEKGQWYLILLSKEVEEKQKLRQECLKRLALGESKAFILY